MTKSYVTIEQLVCPVCGNKHDTGNILLDKHIKNKFDRRTTTGYGLCPEHEEKWKLGFIALVVCDETKTKDVNGIVKPGNEHRTGDIVHIKKRAFKELFQQEPEHPMVFIDRMVFKHIKNLVQKKGGEVVETKGSNETDIGDTAVDGNDTQRDKGVT